jgi:hypothetical protein
MASAPGTPSASGSAAVDTRAPDATKSAGGKASPSDAKTDPVTRPTAPAKDRGLGKRPPNLDSAGKGASKLPPAEIGLPPSKGKVAARSSLSEDEFERGMAAVAARARACFAGTRGTATLQVTVAPSGRVASAQVSGSFAGTPVGACVERAASSARFPAWAGKPQSHAHSYVVSE